MSAAAGLGQKYGKFPASETKECVHGKKKGKCFMVLNKQTHLVLYKM